MLRKKLKFNANKLVMKEKKIEPIRKIKQGVGSLRVDKSFKIYFVKLMCFFHSTAIFANDYK